MARGMVWASALAALGLPACGRSHLAMEMPDAATLARDAAPVDAAAAPLLPAVAQVPWTTAPITIDGDWLEREWDNHALRYVFRGDDGDLARPYSEVRLLRDATSLYVGLYAADEDIEETDFFQVTLGELELRVHPRGDVDASAPGAVAAVDVDGTIGDPDNYDEEWVVEMQVPLSVAAPAPGPVAMRTSRCDITKDQVLRCGAASATVRFDGANPRETRR